MSHTPARSEWTSCRKPILQAIQTTIGINTHQIKSKRCIQKTGFSNVRLIEHIGIVAQLYRLDLLRHQRPTDEIWWQGQRKEENFTIYGAHLGQFSDTTCVVGTSALSLIMTRTRNQHVGAWQTPNVYRSDSSARTASVEGSPYSDNRMIG